jgi:hypothetical protein
MCLSEYDLVCERCRRRFDRIFSVKVETAQQGRELLTKWLRSLCKNCRQLLKEEGFVVEERAR